MSNRSIARYLTKKSMDLLEAEGWTVFMNTEASTGQFSRDAYGIIDFMAFKPNSQPLAVQVTSASNIAARVRKIRECIHLGRIVACMELQAFGWKKHKGRWTLHRRYFFDVGSPYGYEDKTKGQATDGDYLSRQSERVVNLRR